MPAMPARSAVDAEPDARPGTRIDPRHLPYPVLLAGAWSGRLLLIAAAVALFGWVFTQLSFIITPLLIAVLLACLLQPLTEFLVGKARLPRALAALVALLAMIALVVGMLTLAGTQLAAGAQDMWASAVDGFNKILAWLETGPMKVSADQLNQLGEKITAAASTKSSLITAKVGAFGKTLGHFLTGLLICLIATFFFLFEGAKIWRFLLRLLLPDAAQGRFYQASRRGWMSLGSYTRTQVLVAGVDAIGIGIGALVLGVPFVVPLTLLVFFTSFVPIIGAIFSGAIAVLVAFVIKGPVTALIMLGVVIAVQQLEAHVLQPFLMGKAVALHPLAVICAVAVGSFLMGVVGALFAVPVVAVVNATVRYLVGLDQFPSLGDGPMPLDARTDQSETDSPRV